MVQQMILSAFTTSGLQGTTPTSISSWIVDSSASNCMTNSMTNFHDVFEYDITQSFQIVDCSTLLIIVIGNLGSSFKNVFVSLELSISFIYVGQVVDNNCDVHFSRGGCVVQDRVSGTMIAKGPKLVCLFPL